ncbi:hypothetical protein V8E51_000145 [Hyaloscypha variabilis]
MHPKGSVCPPPSPPTSAGANTLLRKLRSLLTEYNTLVKHYDRRDRAIRAIFQAYEYLNSMDMEKLVTRAEKFVSRLGSYVSINPQADRSPREEFDMLERLYASTREDLDMIREELESLERGDDYDNSRPAARPTSGFAPSEEVLQLRGENSVLREENRRLGEELEEAEDTIRRLEGKVAALEEKRGGRR